MPMLIDRSLKISRVHDAARLNPERGLQEQKTAPEGAAFDS